MSEAEWAPCVLVCGWRTYIGKCCVSVCICVCVSMPLCVDKYFECLVVAVSRMVRATENNFSRVCESFQG